MPTLDIVQQRRIARTNLRHLSVCSVLGVAAQAISLRI